MINSIVMRGIKGANTEQPLTGRDIITGRNGAGKTTRAQALGVSLLGYAPGGGKLAAETFKLASASEMTVGLKTDEFEFTRTFAKKEKTVSQTVTIMPPNGEKTAADKEKRIESELGKLPVMLDFSEFIGLSDSNRREFIYSLVDDDNGDIDDVIEMLRQNIKLPESADPKQAELLEAAIEECAAAFTEADTLQDGLKKMNDYAKEQVSYWKKERDKAVGAAQKVSEYKNDIAATDRNLEANRAKLADLQGELQKIAGEIAAAEEKNTNAERIRSRLAEIQDNIANLKEQKSESDPEEIKSLIEQYKSDIKEVDNGSPIKVKQVELESARKKQQQLIEKQNKSREAYYAIKSEKDANIALLDKINNSNGVCAIDCRIKCDNDFSAYISELEAAIEQHTAAMNEAIKAGKEINDEATATAERISGYEKEIERLQNEEIEAHRDNAAIQEVITDLTKDLAAAENFETERAAKIAALEEELRVVPNEYKTPEFASVDVGGLITRRDELKGIVDDLSAQIDEQTKARNALAAMKSTMVDGTEAGYNVENWKAIAEAVGVNGLQGKLVKDVLLPLTDDVQAKLDKIGIARKFRFITTDDKGKEIFQFGWEGENGLRNFDALSTGEQMLLLIALMTTIIERLDPPLKVLVIDNSENLDRENLLHVLNGLTIAGESFDNIIFCGVFKLDPNDAPGWKVWELGDKSDD